MTAKDVLMAAREAVEDMERINEQLGYFEGRTDSITARRVRMLEDRLNTCSQVIDRAVTLLYGDGGIADTKGQLSAEIAELRYLERVGWEDIAERVGYSSRQCIRLCDETLATIDGAGTDSTTRVDVAK